MNPLSTIGDNPPGGLHRTAEGLELHVQAQPGSRRNGITGFHQGRWKVAVSQIAEKGKANVAVANVLAKELQLKPRQLQLVGPALNPLKRFRISGITEDELRLRLQTLAKTFASTSESAADP